MLLTVTKNYAVEIPQGVQLWCDDYTGACNSEDADLISFVSWFKYQYPNMAELIFHIPNESMKPVFGRVMDAKKGLLDGAPDIVIMTMPAICMEAKRRCKKLSLGNTKSRKHFERQLHLLQGFASRGHIAAACFGFEQMKLFIKSLAL